MMSRVIAGELQTAITAFLSGALITIVYDVLRIFRRVLSHNNFWIGVEDFVFWMWTSLWTFSVLYRENDGNLRLYTMVFMAVGMIVYHGTISEPLVHFAGKLLKKLFQILFYPLKMLKIYIIFMGKKLKKCMTGIIMKLTQNWRVCPWRKKNGNKDESKQKT